VAPKRIVNPLKALDVKRLGPGLHADGGNLYLQVEPDARSWIYRFTSPTEMNKSNPTKPRVRDMGLGLVTTISLATARYLAREAGEQVQRAAVLRSCHFSFQTERPRPIR
jgi:hypothetical protein